VSGDPFENYRRQHERLRRAMAGPLERIGRDQQAIQRVLAQPMLDLARMQEQAAAAMQAPAIRALETQDALTQALQGPLRDIGRTQDRVQRALQGPFEQLARNQEALNRALAGPYAAFLRNEELFLNAMRAVAGASEFEIDEGAASATDLTEEEAWLYQWAAAIREWSPSAQQAQDLLNALAFLLGVLALAITIAAPECNVDELLGAVGLLFTAGAYAIKFVSGGD
jgi:hypothetical protein